MVVPVSFTTPSVTQGFAGRAERGQEQAPAEQAREEFHGARAEETATTTVGGGLIDLVRVDNLVAVQELADVRLREDRFERRDVLDF